MKFSSTFSGAGQNRSVLKSQHDTYQCQATARAEALKCGPYRPFQAIIGSILPFLRKLTRHTPLPPLKEPIVAQNALRYGLQGELKASGDRRSAQPVENNQRQPLKRQDWQSKQAAPSAGRCAARSHPAATSCTKNERRKL